MAGVQEKCEMTDCLASALLQVHHDTQPVFGMPKVVYEL